jgi:hypothetical protein
MSDYIPLFTTLAWIALIVGLLVAFRKPLSRIILVLENRIRGGASVKFGSFEIGKLVTQTSDLTSGPSSQTPEVYGNPDQFELLFKVQTKEWKKSTKAFQAPNGCLIQVSTERRSADGSWAVAEAVDFVPGVTIVEEDGGRTLRATP